MQSRFKNIETKLDELAKKLGAELTCDRPGYPLALRTFEERRIDWIDNGINKAIIIQPFFEIKGVDSNKWNFINIAWVDNAKSLKRHQFLKYLVKEEKFDFIENYIDDLINMSCENLIKISMEDLK